LLCYVTDRSLCNPPQNNAVLLDKIAQLSAAGVDWIQIREKDLSGKDCAALVEAALRLAATSSGKSTKIIVNDRLDVALSAGAHGIHLGEQSLSLPAVRKLLKDRSVSPDFLVGVSCHSIDAARLAEQQGAHYIFFGPVFATPSKISFGPPQGLSALEQVSRSLTIPVLAIGGITLENVSSCISAGASGIAAIRLFQNATDPAALIACLRHASPG
jgi:thiamine-phosphate pyrophosphorylase